jgi:hypothetical protein
VEGFCRYSIARRRGCAERGRGSVAQSLGKAWRPDEDVPLNPNN